MNQPPEPDPSSSPNWTSDYFREPVAAGVSPLGRGMVGHVPLVAIGLIVQGALEILFGLMMLFAVLVFKLVPEADLQGLPPMLNALLIGLAVPPLLCGVFRIVVGIFNLRYRRRILGMTALGLGLLTMMTFYCAPTSIALAVYGLVVYLNDSVIAAFALGDAGKKPAEINQVFPPDR